jgi:hypothetical protein
MDLMQSWIAILISSKSRDVSLFHVPEVRSGKLRAGESKNAVNTQQQSSRAHSGLTLREL